MTLFDDYYFQYQLFPARYPRVGPQGFLIRCQQVEALRVLQVCLMRYTWFMKIVSLFFWRPLFFQSNFSNVFFLKPVLSCFENVVLKVIFVLMRTNERVMNGTMSFILNWFNCHHDHHEHHHHHRRRRLWHFFCLTFCFYKIIKKNYKCLFSKKK